jgi:hypothetical protein
MNFGSCSILIVNRGIVSPTLNVNPTLFVIPCEMFGGLCVYSVAIVVTYHAIFHPSFIHPWLYFITSCWQEKIRFLANGWPHPSSMTIFVHLFVRNVIQKITIDTKYHVLCIYSKFWWMCMCVFIHIIQFWGWNQPFHAKIGISLVHFENKTLTAPSLIDKTHVD